MYEKHKRYKYGNKDINIVGKTRSIIFKQTKYKLKLQNSSKTLVFFICKKREKKSANNDVRKNIQKDTIIIME